MKKIFVTICAVLVLVSLIILPFLIRVRVDCKSQYGDCPREVLDRLGSFNGKSLFFVKNGVRKVLKSEFMISDFSLQFKLPNIVQTELLVKKPIFALKDDKSGNIALVDKDGQVLSEASGTVLPTVGVSGGLPKEGQDVGVTNLFALNIASGVNQMYQVGNSRIINGTLLVELPGQIRVIFPLEGDTQILLGSLRLVYLKIQEDNNPGGYSEIDLRFKNPVLR